MSTTARRTLVRTYEVLASLQLAFALMIALGILIAIRALVAQRVADMSGASSLVRWLTALAPERASALTWPTVAGIALFVVNLALSSVEMVRKGVAKHRSLTAPRSLERLPAGGERAAVDGGADAPDVLERLLRRRGWRVRREEEGGEVRIGASRRQAGHWANLAFHLSFFVILVGALLSVLTRFTGYFELAPGETFVEAPGRYLRSTEEPLVGGGPRGFRVHLEKMDLAFWPEGGVRDRASWVRVSDASGAGERRARLAVNSPISFDGVSIYQSSREGFAAGITVTDRVGTRAEGIIHFRFPEREGGPMRTRARLPGTALTLELDLHTGMLEQISAGPAAPRVQESVSWLDAFEVAGGGRTRVGTVLGGAEIEFQGLRLSFDSLRPFMSFSVVRDRGVPVIFLGLALGLVALVAVYFWVPENVWAVVTPRDGRSALVVAGTADRYPASFGERFRELARELERELGRS